MKWKPVSTPGERKRNISPGILFHSNFLYSLLIKRRKVGLVTDKDWTERKLWLVIVSGESKGEWEEPGLKRNGLNIS